MNIPTTYTRKKIMKYSIQERVNMAIKLAIEEEQPKLKEGQTLKVEVLQTDEGMQVNVYPVDKEEKQ
jgi:hypothetical protein|tara:strand:- start:1116 stop:1316 length:201 start_codon:yes stop_codon:yes gene_type:complete